MGIIDGIKKFSMWIAIKKGASTAVKALVAQSPAVVGVLEKYGVKIELNEALILSAILGGLEFGRNYLKHKKGVKWL